jgi:hypothetical protein
MVTMSLPQPTTPSTTREQRGLQIWRERGAEIRHLSGSRWAVPSCSGTCVYIVDLHQDTCSCSDAIWNGGGCKHLIAASVARAMTGECAGCGDRFPHRQLVEVLEDHEALTYFEGDQLCECCAVGHGII